MGVNFPTSPSNNTVTSGYVAKTSPSLTWRDVRGRADAYNRLSNGALQVSQVNFLTIGTNVQGLWMADEWHVYYRKASDNPASIVVWKGELIEALTPGGSDRRARITIMTADPSIGTDKYLMFEQGIEGTRMRDLWWGTANAIPVIVRFGFKGPAGTYSFAIYNGGSANDRCWTSAFTITSAQANTDTLQVFYIPGAPDGDWPATAAAWGWFDISVAEAVTTSSLNQWINTIATGAAGMSNGMATVGNVFEFFDLGMYADPNRTGQLPEFEVPDFTAETRRMQRYIARVYGARGIVGNGSYIYRMGTTLPAPMRIVPAFFIQNGPIGIYDGGIVGTAVTIAQNYSSKNHVNIDVNTTAAGFVAGRAACQYFTDYWDAFIADASL